MNTINKNKQELLKKLKQRLEDSWSGFAQVIEEAEEFLEDIKEVEENKKRKYIIEKEIEDITLEDLINERQKTYIKSMSGLSDMRDIVKLQALGNLATNVLPNIEGRG